jgi:hypothetical protein
VFGSSQVREGEALYQEALELGRLLARAGFDVMTGGYDGVMAAVSRGVHEAGGRVIGVTLSLFDPEPPNPWLHEEQRTEAFSERLRHLTEQADGYIVLRGGIGTLTEFAYTWSLLQTGAVARKPFVVLGESWARLVRLLREDDFRIADEYYKLIRFARTPQEAVAILKSWSENSERP